MTPNRDPSKPRQPFQVPTWIRHLKWPLGCLLLAGLFCFAFFILMIGGNFVVTAPWALLTGWFSFLVRTIPQITWNWATVGMAFLCAVFGAALAQWLLSAFARSQGATWPMRWTWCGFGALGVMFLSGLAIGGSLHQAGWLLTTDEPWIEDQRLLRTSYAYDEIASAIQKEPEDLATWRLRIVNLRQMEARDFRILLILNERGLVQGVILPNFETKYQRPLYLTSDMRIELFEEGLKSLLRENEGRVISF